MSSYDSLVIIVVYLVHSSYVALYARDWKCLLFLVGWKCLVSLY